MSKPLPFMQWYPDDWLGSESRAALSLGGRAAYLDLLNRAWNRVDCILPEDDQELAGFAGCSKQEWKRHRAEVLRRFVKVEGGWRCPRQWRDRQLVDLQSAAQSGRAVDGWSKRRGEPATHAGATDQPRDAGSMPKASQARAGPMPDECRTDAGTVPDRCRTDAGAKPFRSSETRTVAAEERVRASAGPIPSPRAPVSAALVDPWAAAAAAAAGCSEGKLRRWLEQALARLAPRSERELGYFLHALLAEVSEPSVQRKAGFLRSALAEGGSADETLADARERAEEAERTAAAAGELRALADASCEHCGGDGYLAEEKRRVGPELVGRTWRLSDGAARWVTRCKCLAKSESA